MKNGIVFLLLLGLTPFSLASSYYATDKRVVKIDRHCPEGHVSCDHISAQSYDKETGEVIQLSGKTEHRLCKDGITPCRFRGYSFEGKGVKLSIHDDDHIYVSSGEDQWSKERWEYLDNAPESLFEPAFYSHCLEGEYSYLNARMKWQKKVEGKFLLTPTNKLLSICSDRINAPFSRISYRFGPREKVELEIAATVTKEILTNTKHSPDGTKNTFEFLIGDYTYEVAEVIGQYETLQQGIYIDVQTKGQHVATFYSGDQTGLDYQSNLLNIDFSLKKIPLYSVTDLTGKGGVEGFSWGGILRSEPSRDARKKGFLNERQPVVILGITSEQWAGYPWFKIRAKGVEGYTWGGILCSSDYRGKTYCN
ncbi:SH3 domain-containing protein [Aestuariirhabdus sp. Z084]|uniref:SH3 domain-containing protein n=1 Tax=Aestuariirhabdus haliotis TaxID=2918751 RepID=UPI00201B3F91|nr:SH3 domain-containing protein [Aestuariirhabdus haliotis]MCL6416015.1 SH3 domain-containing protein [Aestuariirhabdus haliotis]MCL6419952.1 SH3 domain-containing protein [Aestuariirhabdus haliotis]